MNIKNADEFNYQEEDKFDYQEETYHLVKTIRNWVVFFGWMSLITILVTLIL